MKMKIINLYLHNKVIGYIVHKRIYYGVQNETDD